jgi:phosphate transport system substrate-binding protein
MNRCRHVVTFMTIGALGLAISACGSSSSSKATSGGSTGTSTAAQAVNKLGAAYDTATTSSVTLDGAGANSIEPFFQRVFYDYHRQNPKTTVNYSPAGSSVGIKDMQQGTVDFGDTEIPMSAADEAKAAGPVLQIPVDLGGVAISYNVPGAPKDLHLDGPTLAGIFDGTITKWNSPQIAAVSGVNNLPDLTIIPVHRADSSGPGWDLDDYLIKTSPTWVTDVGTTKASKTWPLAKVGIGEQLNTGVANYVHQTPGAIGFVEYGYALQAGFDNAALKNKAGSFVAPSVGAITADAEQQATLSSTDFSIIDEPGAGSYPLANFSWTLLSQHQSNQEKGIAAGKLVDYVVTQGQADATALGYAPLPANAVQLALSTLAQLETTSGSPLFS